jgi:hypothetical protein
MNNVTLCYSTNPKIWHCEEFENIHSADATALLIKYTKAEAQTRLFFYNQHTPQLIKKYKTMYQLSSLNVPFVDY